MFGLARTQAHEEQAKTKQTAEEKFCENLYLERSR